MAVRAQGAGRSISGCPFQLPDIDGVSKSINGGNEGIRTRDLALMKYKRRCERDNSKILYELRIRPVAN